MKNSTALGIVIWSLGALFFLYEFFLRTFIGSIAHQFIPDLSLNAETYGLIGSAYFLGFGLMQVPVGILADKFGVKKILIASTVTCALATFLFAGAQGFTTAFIGRFFMGLGSSFAFVCLLVITITWFKQRYFASLAGAAQFIGTMGPLLAAGPLIAFMNDAHENWRVALSQIAGFGIILALLILFIVKNKPTQSVQQTISLKVRLLALAKTKQAWCIAAYSGTVYVSIAVLGAIWGTEFLQSHGFSQAKAADIVSLMWLVFALSCPVLGYCSDYIGRRKPFLVICSLIGLLGTMTLLDQQLHYLYIFSFICVAVAASAQNIGFALMGEQVPANIRGTAFGLNNGAITLFNALTIPAVSYFVSRASGHSVIDSSSAHFPHGFALLPILSAISLIIAICCIRDSKDWPGRKVPV